MAILGSVIVGTVQHTATGTADGYAHSFFNGGTTNLGVSNWATTGLFCTFPSGNGVATGRYNYGGTLSVGIGFTNATGTAGSVSNSVSFNATADIYVGGNWTFTCDCERIVAWYDDSDYQTAAGFPTDGGAATPDSPKRVRKVIWDRPRAGGTLSGSVNIGTISLGTSILITALDAQTYTVSHGETWTAGHNATSWAGTTILSGSFDGTALTGPSYNVDTNGVLIQAGTSAFVAPDTGTYGTVTVNANLPRSFKAEIHLREGTIDYPNSIDIKWTGKDGTTTTSVTGSASFSETQRYGTVQANHNGSSGGTGWDEYRGVRMWCDTTSLSNRGESASDWRLQQKSLQPWNALNLAQAGTVTLCGGTTATGTPVSASVVLPDASSYAGLYGTAWQGLSLMGWRYATVYAAFNLASGSAGSVTIGSKSWTQDYQGNALEFGTAQTSRIIDLLCPTSATVTVDTTDTRYPLSASAPHTATEGQLSGIQNAGTFVLAAGQSGTIALGSVTLSRLNHTTLHVLPAFDHFVSAGDGSTYRIDSLWAETDYQKSLETIDFYENSGAYTERTIAQVTDSVNGSGSAYPTEGWSGSAYGTADTYRGSAIRACFLGGQGATYDGGSATYYQHNAVSGTKTIQAQLAVDELSSWVPGDDTNAYGVAGAGTLSIAAIKIFRAGAWGAVHGTSCVAVSGTVVTVTDVTESDSGGTGITDTYGGYYSGTPFVQGGHTGKVAVAMEDTTFAMVPRKFYRVGFRVPGTVPTATGITYDIDRAGRHAIAYPLQGTFVLGIHDDALGLSYGSVSTGIAGSIGCLKWEPSRAGKLYLAYENSGTLYTQYTQNEGTNWTMAGTISNSGTGIRSCFSPDGRKYYFWRNAGSVFARLYDSADTAMGTAYPIVACDNDEIDVDDFVGNAGQWRINLHYRSGGSLITISSVDGVNFS